MAFSHSSEHSTSDPTSHTDGLDESQFVFVNIQSSDHTAPHSLLSTTPVPVAKIDEESDKRMHFMQPWLCVEKHPGAENFSKIKKLFPIQNKVVEIQDDLFLSIAPSRELLIDIWSQHNDLHKRTKGIADGTLKKLAVVSVTSDCGLSQKFNPTVFSIHDIKEFGWEHFHFPWASTEHGKDNIHAEHLLKCVYKIQQLRELGYVVIVHGGSSYIKTTETAIQERTSAAILFLHQMIYDPSPYIDLNESLDKHGEPNLDEIGNLLIETFDILQRKLHAKGFAIAFKEDIPINLDWECVANWTAEQIEQFDAHFDAHKEYIRCAQAMILFYRKNKKIELIHPVLVVPAIDQWIETRGFAVLKNYLVDLVNEDTLDKYSVNDFFQQFNLNFNLARSYFLGCCLDLNKGIENHKKHKKLFLEKHKANPIGKLFIKLYSDLQF